MRLILLTITIQLLFASSSFLEGERNISDTSKSVFKYHQPSSLTANSINHYSVIHFLQYGLLSLIRFIHIQHVLIISIVWEIFELFTYYEWGRESWLNKFCDIVFNILGFYSGRVIIRKYR